MSRLLRAEQGVALIAVMMAIFILTIVVAAMAIATMGESNLSFNQLRGQQALAVAEAGAYRALADLRRRLEVDLASRISAASQANPNATEIDVRNICRSKDVAPPAPNLEMVNILTNYAYPVSLLSTDWVQVVDTATLSIGTAGSRIQMIDSALGTTIGDFYATIAVRWSGAASTCQFGVNVPEQEVMWFDFAILSVGRSGNATRTVCLRSQFADRCPDWFPTPTGGWQGSYTITGGSYKGWPVLIEKASYSQWALMLLDVGSVWLYTGTTINGPVHSNTRIRIAGNPALNDAVTQVLPDMTFLNCGSPANITIPASNPNGTLKTLCDNNNPLNPVFGSTVAGGVVPIPLPSNANPSRTSTGLTPTGANATDAEVRNNTTDDDSMPAGPLPNGLYVMNGCGSPGCGGIYIKGDVQQMSLASVANMQEILLTIQSDPDPARRVMRVSIDPLTKEVRTYWGYLGGDPYNASNWTTARTTYGAGVFNGVIYINGAITSDPDPSASTGLYGIVNKNMRLTIATEGELRITDQLVYEAPPAGPGHNPLNVLGLYSVTGDITIVGALTPNNLYVDGVELAPAGKFWVEGWNSLTGKGNIYSLGGTVQGTFGAFGGFGPLTGYGRVMTYDWRLRSNVSPPFFPLTDIYTAVRYPSPATIFTLGDPLYDRPQWEEMVGL